MPSRSSSKNATANVAGRARGSARPRRRRSGISSAVHRASPVAPSYRSDPHGIDRHADSLVPTGRSRRRVRATKRTPAASRCHSASRPPRSIRSTGARSRAAELGTCSGRKPTTTPSPGDAHEREPAPARTQVHRRVPTKRATKRFAAARRPRPASRPAGGGRRHHRDAVAERERLVLVVRHVHGRHARRLLHPPDLRRGRRPAAARRGSTAARRAAAAGAADERAPERHALALAAGKLRRAALRAATSSGRPLRHALGDRLGRRAARAQAERDVLRSRTGAGTARTTGTPSPPRASTGRPRSRRARRSARGRRRPSRARRRPAARSSCPTRTGRGRPSARPARPRATRAQRLAARTPGDALDRRAARSELPVVSARSAPSPRRARVAVVGSSSTSSVCSPRSVQSRWSAGGAWARSRPGTPASSPAGRFDSRNIGDSATARRDGTVRPDWASTPWPFAPTANSIRPAASVFRPRRRSTPSQWRTVACSTRVGSAPRPTRSRRSCAAPAPRAATLSIATLRPRTAPRPRDASSSSGVGAQLFRRSSRRRSSPRRASGVSTAKPGGGRLVGRPSRRRRAQHPRRRADRARPPSRCRAARRRSARAPAAGELARRSTSRSGVASPPASEARRGLKYTADQRRVLRHALHRAVDLERLQRQGVEVGRA